MANLSSASFSGTIEKKEEKVFQLLPSHSTPGVVQQSARAALSPETSYADPEESLMWQLEGGQCGRRAAGMSRLFCLQNGSPSTPCDSQPGICPCQSGAEQLILMRRSTDWMWLTAGPKGLWLLPDSPSQQRCPVGLRVHATVYWQSGLRLYWEWKPKQTKSPRLFFIFSSFLGGFVFFYHCDTFGKNVGQFSWDSIRLLYVG